MISQYYQYLFHVRFNLTFSLEDSYVIYLHIITIYNMYISYARWSDIREYSSFV